MFHYDSSKLNELAADFRETVTNTFAGTDTGSPSFCIPAALAACIKTELDLEWLMEHYYAKRWSAIIPAMLTLYDALVKAGHDETNSYEIGRCDRYVGYVNDDSIKAKVMLFENQNVTYAVVLGDGFCYSETSNTRIPASVMHVRIVTPSRDSMDNKAVRIENVTKNMLKGCDAGLYDTFNPQASEYFLYKDMRDRGYIATVKPYMMAVEDDKVFYTIERPGSAHPSSVYVLRELEGFASYMNEVVKELSDNS